MVVQAVIYINENLAGLLGIENAETESQKEHQHDEKSAVRCAVEDAIFIQWGLGATSQQAETESSSGRNLFALSLSDREGITCPESSISIRTGKRKYKLTPLNHDDLLKMTQNFVLTN